nr:unnamed protein product [Callosobruchus chinensis]
MCLLQSCCDKCIGAMTLCTVGNGSAVQQSRASRRIGRPGNGKTCPHGSSNRPKDVSAKLRTTYRRSLDPCDNSDDSGIGVDHHFDSHHHSSCSDSGRLTWSGAPAEAKRLKLDIKLEHEEYNDNYCFPDHRPIP